MLQLKHEEEAEVLSGSCPPVGDLMPGQVLRSTVHIQDVQHTEDVGGCKGGEESERI